MNGEHPSTERLQLGYDGELPTREAAEVSAHVAACPDCQGYVSRLGRLGQFVRIAAEDASREAAEPDFTQMFAQIQRAIAHPPDEAATLIERLSSTGDAGDVSHAGDARGNHDTRTNRGAVSISSSTASSMSRRAHSVSRWVSRGAPALGAVALAAAALLMVYRQDSLPSDVTDAASYEAVVNTGHSEIVAVDFGSNAGTVFDIPMSDGSSVPVVWIDDDDDEEE